MNGYVLVSYGPRPTGDLRACKAARQQIRNLEYLAQNLPNKPGLHVYHDYARTITSLNSLPVLKDLLERAKERNTVIFIDSYQRLFVKCRSNHEHPFLNELLDYSENFRDIQTGKMLREFPESLLARILTTQPPFKYVLGQPPKSNLSAKGRLNQTRKATRASQAARATAADRKAKELKALKDELEPRLGSVSIAQLARVANERGLTTDFSNECSQ